MKKKTFDAVAFMRKRREELSCEYADLNWQEIEKRIQQALKDDPLWRKNNQSQTSISTRKKMGDCPNPVRPWICCSTAGLARCTMLLQSLVP